MSNKESQKDKMCGLESIYNEVQIQTYEQNGLFGGQFYAHVDLPAGLKIIFKDLRKKDVSLEELQLKYLPPLSLCFSLPCDYPSHSSPTYTLSCQSLQSNKITDILDVSSLETTYKEYEEFQEAMKACCLEEGKEKKNEDS